MRIKLADALATKRDKIEAIAVEFGAQTALSMALREGFWPSADDLRRWCVLVRQADAGTSARLDSGLLASERLAIRKWQALDARGWLYERDELELEHLAKLAQAAERERWVAQRAAELAEAKAEAEASKHRAAAEREWKRGPARAQR